MSSSDMTWGESLNEVLDSHDVRDSVGSLLLWEVPSRTGMVFGAGVALYIMVDQFDLRVMMILGSMAILQLVVYRLSAFLQARGMAFEDVDLRERFVLTPEPSTVSKTVEICGDVLRIIEESLKELSLTSDYARLLQGFSTLLFLSALGRVVRLPVLLIVAWTISFVAPIAYVNNQRAIDGMMDKSASAINAVGSHGKNRSSKRSSRRQPEEEDDFSGDDEEDYASD